MTRESHRRRTSSTGIEDERRRVARRRRWRWLLLATIGGTTILVVLFFNPGDLFTRKSSSFSFDRFQGVLIGDSVESAVKVLGEPLSVSPSTSCEGCKVYLFMGEYPQWVFGGTECWLVVNSEGSVIDKVHLQEP